VRYGDRILVLKYLYLVSDAKRWDVVVFKAPYKPARYDYGQNYIKRLIGLPGEAIFILDGDIYVGKPGAPPEQFVVQTKPDHVQDALWRIVADNDYQPRGLGHWVQPWTELPGASGWDTSGRRFTFDNLQGASTIQFDPSRNPDKHALTDWLAYDVTAPQQDPHRRDPLPQRADTYHVRSYTPHNNVSDVKLSFYYDRRAGDGPLTVQVSKLDHTFTARLSPQGAQLLMRRGDEPDLPVGPMIPLRESRGGRGAHVELINVDYQVSLRIDGREVARTTPQQYRPNIAYLLGEAERHQKLAPPQVRITAERQQATLSHIALWRDVYYLNRSEGQGGGAVRWGRPPNLSPDWPGGVMRLGAGEYFVLGDNSLLSGDARTWEEPIELPDEELSVEDGRVPERFMIGKAFFVYWPAGYRPIDSAPALVPNFGDMRFIR
jgi:signal peptidase I